MSAIALNEAQAQQQRTALTGGYAEGAAFTVSDFLQIAYKAAEGGPRLRRNTEVLE